MTDGATPFDLRDLSNHHADRAGCTGDDDRLAGLRLADVEQTEVRRHPRHAERAEIHRQRRETRIDFRQPFAVDSRVFLDADRAVDVVAFRESGMPGFEHFTDTARAHHFADAHRRDVRLHVVHPAAHCGIEREVRDLHEHFAFVRRAHGLFGVVPVAALRQADGPGCKAELMIECRHGGAPLFSARCRQSIRLYR